MVEQVLDELTPLALFVMVGIVVWIISRENSHKDDLQAETARRLIDKLDTGQEAMTYLDSESGRKLLDTISTPAPRADPRRRIIAALSVGAVFCCLGVGLLILSALYPDDDTLSFAVMVLALGSGFLAAAGVSYRLSKSWGLLDSAAASTRRSPAASRDCGGPRVE